MKKSSPGRPSNKPNTRNKLPSTKFTTRGQSLNFTDVAKKVLINRCIKHLSSPHLCLHHLQDTNTSQRRRTKRANPTSNMPSRNKRMGAFHPIWARHISRANKKLMMTQNWNMILSEGFYGFQDIRDRIANMQISWYNGPAAQPHMNQVVTISPKVSSGKKRNCARKNYNAG